LPLLTTFLISKFAPRRAAAIDSISKRTMERMYELPVAWKHPRTGERAERAVILSSGPMLEIDESVFAATASPTTGGDDAPVPVLDIESVERNHILSILKHTNWVIERPARRGDAAQAAPQHAPEPAEEDGHQPRDPRGFVAATRSRGPEFVGVVLVILPIRCNLRSEIH
jgi:hypothetical protein